MSIRQVHWPAAPEPASRQTTMPCWHWSHGMVPYTVLSSATIRRHCPPAPPHWPLLEHTSYSCDEVPHEQRCSRVSQPYWYWPEVDLTEGQLPQRTRDPSVNESHAAVLQQVLSEVHDTSELCPSDGRALAQHIVGTCAWSARLPSVASSVTLGQYRGSYVRFSS